MGTFNLGDISKDVDMATKSGGYARLPFEGLLQVNLQEFSEETASTGTPYVKMIFAAAEPDTSGVIFENVMVGGPAAWKFGQFLVAAGVMTQEQINAGRASKTAIDINAVCSKLVADKKAITIEIANEDDQKGGVRSEFKNFVAPERYADAVSKNLHRRFTTAAPKAAAAPTAAAAATALAGVL